MSLYPLIISSNTKHRKCTKNTTHRPAVRPENLWKHLHVSSKPLACSWRSLNMFETEWWIPNKVFENGYIHEDKQSQNWRTILIIRYTWFPKRKNSCTGQALSRRFCFISSDWDAYIHQKDAHLTCSCGVWPSVVFVFPTNVIRRLLIAVDWHVPTKYTSYWNTVYSTQLCQRRKIHSFVSVKIIFRMLL